MKTEIYKYQQFIDNQTLYVFDFDDTLVNTPSFEDKAKVFIGENLNTKDLLDSVTREIGVNLFDLRYQDGRIFVNDPDELINQSKHWIRKGKRLYLITPDVFSYTKDSMPDSLKEWSELYKNVDNKCIVTARPEAIRPMVIKTLTDFGLELPKYGLHMMPQGRTNAGMWKGEKIVEIINKTNFRKAIFFDDNSKYIKKATKVIKEKLPNLIWEPVKVS
jgi:hypothetical protein